MKPMNLDALKEHPSADEPVVSAARRFLAGTADSITPDTPAGELLACLAGYRAHLAAVVATPVTGAADEQQR
jgi:hypothetical protein